jgi:hypothetical protein
MQLYVVELSPQIISEYDLMNMIGITVLCRSCRLTPPSDSSGYLIAVSNWVCISNIEGIHCTHELQVIRHPDSDMMKETLTVESDLGLDLLAAMANKTIMKRS